MKCNIIFIIKMDNENILRDLGFIKKIQTDCRAPYPWLMAFKITSERYNYICDTYYKQMKEFGHIKFRVVRFVSLKYDIAFDFVITQNSSWDYLKSDIISTLHKKGHTDITNVKITYDHENMPVSEILLPYVIIPDCVFVHLSLVKKNNIWSF